MKTLILYSSHDGQTKKIAAYIAEIIKENVDVKSISDVVNQFVTGISINNFIKCWKNTPHF